MTDVNTIIDDDVIAKLYIPMYRFAYNQLGDEQCARDVVQEALMNALKYADSFQGRSALKSWMFAILKNKISDHIRQTQNTYLCATFQMMSKMMLHCLNICLMPMGIGTLIAEFKH